MRKIELTQGKYALVDNSDFEFLNQFKWHLHAGRYAVRWNTKVFPKKRVFMHYQILERRSGLEIDHSNRDSLDNCRSNLKYVSHKENSLNIGLNKNNSSGFKRVAKESHGRNWRAYIYKPDRKYTHLGCFSSKEEAARAYNTAASALFGKSAVLNEVEVL